MTEDDNTEVNTALMLDEKIEERIHLAVGKLFGFDATKNYFMPQPDPNSTSGLVRKYFMQEVAREISRAFVNDPEIVRGLYEQMLYVQHSRQQSWHNSTSTTQQFF